MWVRPPLYDTIFDPVPYPYNLLVYEACRFFDDNGFDLVKLFFIGSVVVAPRFYRGRVVIDYKINVASAAPIITTHSMSTFSLSAAKAARAMSTE